MSEIDDRGFSLTDREKAILVSSAVVAFIAGMWAGWMSIPVEALDIPVQERRHQGVSRDFHPIPTFGPLGSVFLIGIGLWVSYQYLRPNPAGEADLDE